MKLLLSFVVVMLAFTVGSFAADCEIDGHKFNTGDTYTPPGHCELSQCHGQGITSTLHCGPTAIPGDCEFVPEDYTKPYPICCAKVKC